MNKWQLEDNKNKLKKDKLEMLQKAILKYWVFHLENYQVSLNFCTH